MPNYTIKSTKIDKTNFNNNQPHNYTSNNNSSNIITKIEENNNNNIENNIETLDINNEYSENNLLSTYINNLQKYGFTETDINRVLNGEIELETLYNEIQKDNDNTRRTLLMESQYLQNSCNTMNQIYAAEGKQLNLNYNNIKELEEDIKNIKNILKTKNEDEALLLREELELKNYIYNTTINEVSYWMKNIDPYIIEEDYAEKSQFDPNALEIINKVKKEWDKQISVDPEAIPNINLSNEDLTSMLYCIMNNKAKESDSLGIYTDNLIYNNYLKWKDFLKEEELTTFNYIYNKKGAKEAYNYLANLSHTLDKRYIQDKQSKDAKHATSSIFNSYMASEASVFLGVPEAWKTLFSSAKAMIDKNIHGKEEQELYLTNTYSTSDTYRSAVAQRIAAYNDKLSFLYSTGMSMADTGLYLAMNIATGGTMSLPLSIGLMGSRAYSSTLNDMLGRGISDEVAVGIAAGSAAIESLMEAWSAGHIFKLEGHLSDSVIKGGKELAKRIDNPVIIKAYQILAEAACQSICEGEEEVSTELCNILLEEVSLFFTKQSNKGSILTSINEYESKGYNKIDAICKTIEDIGKRIGFSFLGGAISGASFGSVKAISDVNQTDKALQQGKYGNLNGNKSEQLAQAFEINKKEINLMQDTYKRLNSLGLIKENTNIDIKQIQDLLINKIINEEEALIMIKGTTLTPKADLITPTELKQIQELIYTKELSEYQAQIAYIYSKLYNYDLPLAADIAKIVDEEKIDRSRALELLEELKGPNPKEIEEINKTLTLNQYRNLDNKIQQALTILNHQEFNLEKFMNRDIGDGGILLITDHQSVMTDNYTTKHEKEGGEHGWTVESIYKAIYGSDYKPFFSGIWQYDVMSKGDICIQLCDDIDSIVWIPNELSTSQFKMLESFNKQIKEIYKNNPVYFDEHPMKFSSNINIETNNNLDAILEEVKKRITKEETLNNETIVGDTIEGLNSNNIQDNNITQLSKQEIELFIDEYLKDPTITIPKGISNELVEYLEKYLHDPDATCPTSIPTEIIEYINNKAINNTITTQKEQIQKIVNDYISNIVDYYYVDGITLVDFFKKYNIETKTADSNITLSEIIGDEKLYLLETLDDLDWKMSGSDRDNYLKIKDKPVADILTSDLLDIFGKYLTQDELDKISELEKKYKKDLSLEELAAIFNYTSCGGFEINAWLNNIKGMRQQYSTITDIQEVISGYDCGSRVNRILDASQGNIINLLDSAISRGNYDNAIVCYRGAQDLWDYNKKIDPNKLQAGDRFSSAGYQSSSALLENCYAVDDPDTNIILEIIIPPHSIGTALYIEDITGCTNYCQTEILIKRDAEMTVIAEPYDKIINGEVKKVIPVVVQ